MADKRRVYKGVLVKTFSTVLSTVIFIVSNAVFAQVPSQVVPGEYLIKFKLAAGGPSLARNKLSGKASLKGS